MDDPWRHVPQLDGTAPRRVRERTRIAREPAPTRRSRWRIIAPLLLLPFVLPSTAVLIIAAFGIGPARPNGELAGGLDMVAALLWASPTALWAVGWLFRWSGEGDVIETRIAFGLVASLASLILCFWLWLGVAIANSGPGP